MFGYTKRRKFRNRVVAASIGAVVLAVGIWINIGDNVSNKDAKNTSNQIKVETENKDKIEINEEINDKNEVKTGTYEAPNAYLVKEVDGVVKVFLCNEDGSQTLYLITSIPFELLSETDQKMFKEGVNIDTQEDLGRFLENFDS